LTLMTEKELIVKLIHTDEDAHYIFNVFKDNHKKGKFAFKRLRAQKLLGNKSQIDELSASVRARFADGGLDVLLLEFLQPEAPSHLQQFLLVREFYPEFLRENWDAVRENIEQKKPPFSGVSAHKTEEQALHFYQHRYGELNGAALNAIWQESIHTVKIELKLWDVFEQAVKGKGLLGLDKLLGGVGPGDGFEVSVRESYFMEHRDVLADADIRRMEQGCRDQLVRLAIITVFLEAGECPNEVRLNLMRELQRAYFLAKTQILGLGTLLSLLEGKNEYDQLNLKYQQSQKERTALSQKNQEISQQNSAIKRGDETLKQQIAHLKQVINEQNEKLGQSARLQVAGQEELEKIAQLSQKEQAHLKSRLQSYENLAKGYQWLLSRDLSVHEVAVVYSSPLLYAKHIYHEVLFMGVSQALKEPFKAQKLLVQLVGLSGKEKKQLEKLASAKGVEAVMLESVDERDLIMDIACYLKESEGVFHESA